MKSDNLAEKIQPTLLELFKSVFRGRQDVVPELWVSMDGRKGYGPICKNNRVSNKCLILKGIKSPCKTCIHKEYAPLTDELLQEHLDGKTTLGVYPLLPGNICYFLAGDFDNHDGERNPLTDVKAYYEACQAHQIPCYVLRSRSGAGYHAYIFFQEPVQALKARLVAFYLLQQGGVIGSEENLSSFDRLFPNQDQLAEGKIGNLIALPFQGEAVKNGNTVFLDPTSGFVQPYQDQEAILGMISYVSETDLDRIIEEQELKQKTPKPTVSVITNYKPTTQIEKLLKCDFIRWCRDNQADVSEPLWFAMLSNVARLSPGGYDLCHEFSRKHPKYSYQEAEEKIRHALNDTKPHTCQYIKENGFNCGKDCGVKSPIALLHKHVKEQPLDLDKAKELKTAIIELSKKEPDKIVDEIRSNRQFMGSLVLLADKDKDQFEDTLKQMGANKVDTEVLEGLVNEVASGVEGVQRSRLPRMIDKLPGAPIGPELVLPKNWDISYKSGLEKITAIRKNNEDDAEEKIENVIYTPLVISGRMVDVVDNKETFRLCWYRDGQWNFLEVEKNKIAATRNITGLADYGLPVNSLNAKDLVEYFADFEKYNIAAIPLGRSSRHLGWQDNYQGFLWGRNYLTTEVSEDQGAEKSPLNSQGNQIGFRGTDTGNEQIADAFTSHGAFETWVAAINQLFLYPRVMAGVYFSLATPLLHILDAPNFTVDWAGGTSTGKTTTLRIAASCWGSPNERSQKSVMFTWDASKVWIERTAAILNGLPLILDDTKLAGKGTIRGSANGLISDILYTIAEGRGRGRGSIEGTQHTGTWQTILLSTGEQSAVDFSMGDGGTRARVISLWGPPFGQGTENLAAFVRYITLSVKEHYGHAGPKLIHYILSNQEQWPIWKQECQVLQRNFAQKAGNNPVADRVSGYFAILATVIPIVHAGLPELRRDVKPEEIIEPLWQASIGVAEEADRAIAALQVAYDYAVAHQDGFWGRHQNVNNEPRCPSGGWLGRWDHPNWSFIGYNTGNLENYLMDATFDVAAVIKTWRDRGYLETDKAGRGKQVRVNTAQTYLYCIKRSVIESVLKIKEVEEE